jgi:putative ABC transport system permease protein
VLAFTLGVSVLTGVVFGLAPAWRASRVNLQDALKEGGRGESGGASSGRLRGALVVGELALSLVLLIGAGLLVKSLWLLSGVEPGFEPSHLLTVRVELPEARYKEVAQQTVFRERVLEELNSLPGTRAAMVSELPLGGESLMHNFVIEGRPALAPGDEPELYARNVGGDYFNTMRIPLREGRAFNAQDTADSPPVGVVNEAFAREYFPGQSPVGARIRWARQSGPPQWVTIVGVAGDVKHFGLDKPEAAAIYMPFTQAASWERWMFLVVRSDADPAALAGAVKARVWSADSQIPVTKVLTMEEVAAASVAGRRFQMALLGLFAAVALALACVGLYGVIAYSVARRTREIGVRMALGARAGDILGLVVRQGLVLASAGLAAGVAGALALTRLLAGLVYGVSTTDPATYAALSLLLLLVALLACLIPARRATKVNPMTALRYE